MKRLHLSLISLVAASCTNFTATCIEKGTCERGDEGTGGAAGDGGDSSSRAGGAGGGTDTGGTAGGGAGGMGGAGGAAAGGQGPGGSASAVDCSTEPCGYLSSKATLVGLSDHADIAVTLTPGDFTTVTTQDGSYRLDDIPVGDYTLRLEKGPYEETVPTVGIRYGVNAVVIADAQYPMPEVELPRARRVLDQIVFVQISPNTAPLIAYDSRFLTGTKTLHVKNILTDAVTNIDEAGVFDFAFSPDGSALYWRNESRELRYSPIEGGGSTLIDSGVNIENYWPGWAVANSEYAFTPDQRWLVYPHGKSQPIRRMRALHSDAQLLLGTGNAALTFSEQGDTALHLTAERQLVWVWLSSGQVIDLTPEIPDSPREDPGPKFQISSDGTRVAYENAEGLHVATRSAQAPIREHVAVSAERELQILRFTPSGSHLLYLSEATDEPPTLFAARTDGSGSLQLTSFFGSGALRDVNSYPVHVTAFDRVIYPVVNEEGVSAYDVALAGGGSERLSDEILKWSSVALTRDRRRLIYMAEDGNSNTKDGLLYTRDLETGTELLVARDVVTSSVTLAPNSRHVVFAQHSDGIGSLMSADLLTGDRLTLGSGINVFSYSAPMLTVTPDEERILFIGDRETPDSGTSVGTLKVASWDGNTVFALARNIKSIQSISPDSRYVAFVAEGILLLAPISGGDASSIARKASVKQWQRDRVYLEQLGGSGAKSFQRGLYVISLPPPD